MSKMGKIKPPISPKLLKMSKIGHLGGQKYIYSDFHGYNITNNDILRLILKSFFFVKLVLSLGVE